MGVQTYKIPVDALKLYDKLKQCLTLVNDKGYWSEEKSIFEDLNEHLFKYIIAIYFKGIPERPKFDSKFVNTIVSYAAKKTSFEIYYGVYDQTSNHNSPIDDDETFFINSLVQKKCSRKDLWDYISKRKGKIIDSIPDYFLNCVLMDKTEKTAYSMVIVDCLRELGIMALGIDNEKIKKEMDFITDYLQGFEIILARSGIVFSDISQPELKNITVNSIKKPDNSENNSEIDETIKSDVMKPLEFEDKKEINNESIEGQIEAKSNLASDSSLNEWHNKKVSELENEIQNNLKMDSEYSLVASNDKFIYDDEILLAKELEKDLLAEIAKANKSVLEGELASDSIKSTDHESNDSSDSAKSSDDQTDMSTASTKSSYNKPASSQAATESCDSKPASSKAATKSSDNSAKQTYDVKKTTSKKDQSQLDEIYKSLHSLEGISSVKEEVHFLIDFAKVVMLRRQNNMTTMDIPYVFLFSGNPGSGKATVAELISKSYKQFGLISKGHFVEYDLTNLPEKTSTNKSLNIWDQLFKKSKGGLLFVDGTSFFEASDKRAKSNEVISNLLEKYESSKEKFILVLAIKNENVDDILNSKLNIKSKFNKHFIFEKFKPEDVLQMLIKIASSLGYNLSEEAKSSFLEHLSAQNNIDEYYDETSKILKDIIDKAIYKQISRVAKIENPSREILEKLDKMDFIF